MTHDPDPNVLARELLDTVALLVTAATDTQRAEDDREWTAARDRRDAAWSAVRALVAALLAASPPQ